VGLARRLGDAGRLDVDAGSDPLRLIGAAEARGPGPDGGRGSPTGSTHEIPTGQRQAAGNLDPTEELWTLGQVVRSPSFWC
jgi:hypothetical protein